MRRSYFKSQPKSPFDELFNNMEKTNQNSTFESLFTKAMKKPITDNLTLLNTRLSDNMGLDEMFNFAQKVLQKGDNIQIVQYLKESKDWEQVKKILEKIGEDKTNAIFLFRLGVSLYSSSIHAKKSIPSAVRKFNYSIMLLAFDAIQPIKTIGENQHEPIR